MLKACSECGHKISTNARICPYCGNEPVNYTCADCYAHRLTEEDSTYPRCQSPHGVCPAFFNPESHPDWQFFHDDVSESCPSDLTSW